MLPKIPGFTISETDVFVITLATYFGPERPSSGDNVRHIEMMMEVIQKNIDLYIQYPIHLHGIVLN
jgi:hypothetical protein